MLFILYIPKKSKIKDLNDIEKRINRNSSNTSTNAQLSNSYWPNLLLKTSALSQDINVNKSVLSDLEPHSDFKVDFNFENKGGDLCDLITDVPQDQM